MNTPLNTPTVKSLLVSFYECRHNFDRVCENKSGFFVLIFWPIRTQADMPPFGCDRMTTDKGGLMESRVWFWGAFSVRDVHWQKEVEKGSQHQKQSRSQIA